MTISSPKGYPTSSVMKSPGEQQWSEGVIAQKQGHALQRSYRVRGPDLASESDEVQGAAMLQANEVFKRLGGEWMLHSEAQRTRVLALPPVEWPHPIPHLIDERRRQDMLVDRESRETTYYMTLTWTPPKPILRRGLRYFIHGPGHPMSAGAENDLTASARHVYA